MPRGAGWTGQPRRRRARHQAIWTAAAVTFLIFAVATRSGMGISTDSVAYLAEARQLREGQGLTVPAGLHEMYDPVETAGEVVPAVHFPPLFPMLLALTNATSSSSARWLNGVLLAVIVLTVAIAVWWYTSSRWTAWLAGAVVLLSPGVLRTSSMVWSEPLFIALGLVGLVALTLYLEEPTGPRLVTASVSIGLAWLTRYAGIALVLTGLIVLACRGPRPRWRTLPTFLLLSVLPMASFLSYASLSEARGAGYTLRFHQPAPRVIREGVESLRTWLLPAGTGSPLRVLGFVLLGALLYALISRREPIRPAPPDHAIPQLPVVLAAFVPMYLTVLVASVSAFAEYVPLEERFFVPAYPVAVVLVSCLVSKLPGRPGLLRHTALLAVAVVVASTGAAGVALVRHGARDAGFAAKAWTHSPAIGFVAGLTDSTRIYSNFPEAIYISTGRLARLIPRHPLPGDTDHDGQRVRVDRFVKGVREEGAIVVLFSAGRHAYLPDYIDVSAELGVPPAVILLDALVWRHEERRQIQP
jgi:hypothetical protein